MIREIKLNTRTIEIEEGKEENVAGNVVWDAALCLIKYIDHSKNLITAEQKAIEIGAGTGAVGLAAAALGAKVILTDLHHLEGLITANIARNNLSAKASFSPLCWGETIPSDISAQPPFDLILASDVLYQHDWIDPLISTLKDLSGPCTQIFLANEHRPKLPFPENRFLAAGFQIHEVPYAQLHPEWRSPDIQVYKLKLCT